jgi:protein disulfide-isomerase A4
VDATIEKELAEEYKVQGYPSMKIFRNGKDSEYNGPREAHGISDYMIRHSGDATTLYDSYKSVKEFMVSNGDGAVFLGVFKDAEDPLYKLFIEANDELREDYKFGHTFNAKVKDTFGLKGESAIVVCHPDYMISNYEKRYQFYTDNAGSASAIQEFYKKYQVPLVGHYETQSEKKFAKRPLVLVFYDVSFDAKVRSLTQYWREKVLRVAREYPDIQFAVANEESYEEKMKELGLHESGEDVNVGLYDEQERKFALIDEEFSEESLTEFIDTWKKGKLKPILKSQPVAPRAKPGKVQVVVGNSFDDIVMDESKEVFIEFYAPWCGHCKKLEPVYNKLAKSLKDEKDIVIAKIDATANDIPPTFKVEGFPTMYYVLPGKKNDPIKFESGDRDVEGMKKFIKENSVVMNKSGKDEL